MAAGHEIRDAAKQVYNLQRFDFMAPQGPAMPVTETDVCIPPALWIRDNEDALWTLGFDYSDAAWLSGKWEFDVVRNGVKTGEFARNIEYKRNSYGHREVRIWGADGWRAWRNGRFV